MVVVNNPTMDDMVKQQLLGLIEEYKCYERLDGDGVPSKGSINTSYSPRGGSIGLVHVEIMFDGMFRRRLIVGVRIGSKFAEPKSYSYPCGEDFMKALEERNVIIKEIENKIKGIIVPHRLSNGGFYSKISGTAYSVYGWFVD